MHKHILLPSNIVYEIQRKLLEQYSQSQGLKAFEIYVVLSIFYYYHFPEVLKHLYRKHTVYQY